MATRDNPLCTMWQRIESAMRDANRSGNPAIRRETESLVDSYFAFMDTLVLEAERRRNPRESILRRS